MEGLTNWYKGKAETIKNWYRCNRHRLKLATASFAANAIGGLLPLYLGALVLLIGKRLNNLSDFYGNGEFALYAASFAAPILYQLFGDMKKPFPHRMLLGLSCVVVLVLASGVFSAIFQASKAGTQVDSVRIGWITTILLITAVAVSTLTTFFDLTISVEDVDLQQSDKQNVDDLEKKLAALGGTNG